VPLSVIVLTRNEATNIERCLNSVAWADEIVVVDAESEDETRAIAEQMGAKVIVHPWQGAGAQYALGIAHATGDWVLVVDADEEVTPELADAIRCVIVNPDALDGYRVKRVNYVLGRWLRYGGWQEWVVRLFRRDKVISPPTLHPRFQVQGRVGYLPYPLRHYMAPDLLDWWQRSFRLARTEAAVEFLQGVRFSGWALLGGFWKFVRRFIFKGGFLDGWAGFYACLHRFLYIAVKQAHLLELERGKSSRAQRPETAPFK
jgi:glycosyltransferase involved in cell wall biosynthesis